MSYFPKIREFAEEVVGAAYRFVAERLLWSKNPVVKWSLDALEKSYDATDNRRKQIECKKLKIYLHSKYKFKPGMMARTINEFPVRENISTDISNRRWTTIPRNEYVMYLDVIHDENYDIPVIQVLWSDKILYMYGEGKFSKSFENLTDSLEIIHSR